MGAIGFLALFGFGIMALVLNDDDTPATDEEVPPDTEPPASPPKPEELTNPVVSGVDIMLDGQDVVVGTEGDDTLIALPESPEEADLVNQTSQIDLLKGNDELTIRSEAFLTINAGEGDDMIVSNGLGNTIYGDAGNDTISAGSADLVFGGAGDDRLSFSATDLNDSAALLDGGDGDDSLSVGVTVGAAPTEEDTAMGGFRLLGGAGADLFDLTVDVADYGVDASAQVSGLPIRLSDFVAGEDSLVVDLTAEDRLLSTSALVPGSLTFGGETTEFVDLVLTFAATGTQPEVEVFVRLIDPHVTLDDITILTAAAG